ncbi:MAG: hypothetical protein ACK4NQ_11375 [Fimbriimonadaceae bacterium]
MPTLRCVHRCHSSFDTRYRSDGHEMLSFLRPFWGTRFVGFSKVYPLDLELFMVAQNIQTS